MKAEKELDKFLSLVYSNKELKIVNYLKNHPHIPDNSKYSNLNFPKKVLIEINNSCNLRCKMCFVESRSNNQLSFHKITEILKEVKKHKSIVSYSSLEPFFRKDFMRIVKFTSKMKIPFSIVTNGTLIDRATAESLVKYKPVSVTISLHGTSDIHDRITGVKGSFKRALSAVESLLYFKEKYNQKLPFIRLNFAVSSLNYKNMEKFVNELGKYDLDIRINHLRWLDEKYFSQGDSALKKSLLAYSDYAHGFNNSLNKLDTQVLANILNRITNKKNITCIPQLEPEEISPWYSDLNFVRNKKCLYLLETAVVDTSGEVHPCAFIRYSYGNIKKLSLSKIWNSKKAKDFKLLFLHEGIFPVCRRCCKL